MGRIDELIEEANRVKEAIDATNGLINHPSSDLGTQFTNSIKKNSGYLAAKIGPQLSKALHGGRPEEIIFGGTVLAVAWAGAYAIDGIANGISVAKAKKILVSYYKELAVKQDMLVMEQQNLIEQICAENQLQGEELVRVKERLNCIKDQIEVMRNLQKNKSV